MDVNVGHSNYYMGSMFNNLIFFLVDGFPEMSVTIERLKVFYKQKELCFYPAWAYAILASIIGVPLSFAQSLACTCLPHYSIGYTPEVQR